jgi:diaminopimelate epimerase
MIGEAGFVLNEELLLPDGVTFTITSLSVGNPHVVVFVEDVEKFPVEKYGPLIENHNLFPQRTNVEFVQVLNRKEVLQRTWERGAGETLACGTGASAVTVASVLTDQCDRKITVHLRGGDLKLEWDQKSNHIFMTGPAVEVFTGQWKL